MKTKNTMLGLCSVIFAVGSAFATSEVNTLTNRQIKVDTRMIENPEVCVDQTGVYLPITAFCIGSSFSCLATVNSTALWGGSSLANVRDESCFVLSGQTTYPVASLTNNCITKVY